MKVVITDANREQYRQLFEDFQTTYSNILNEAGLVVYNPEEPDDLRLSLYYAGLAAVIATDSKPSNKFFHLPVDEPTFEVDMDTRTISVPTFFRNNGLGVIGDANAEMIFFTMTAFDETSDLYNCVQSQHGGACWVQWRNTSDNSTGNSKIIFHDKADDLLYLGWLITPDMTRSAGNLEFSLRFFKTVNGEITYSINTQPATCSIKSTINYDVANMTVEDMSDLVYTRPSYSGVVNNMNGASARIVTNITPGEYDLMTTGAVYNRYYDPEDEDIDNTYGNTYKNGVYEFAVTAESPDGGTIEYQWYQGGSQIPNAKSNKYAANTAGTYSVRIGNTKQGVGTRWTESASAVIPAAREIQFSKQHSWPLGIYSNGTALTVSVCDKENQGPANGTLQYTWTKKNLDFVDNHTVVAAGEGSVIANANTNTYTPDEKEEGAYTCSIVNYRNNTTSDPIVTEKQVIVRAEPDAPKSIALHYDFNTKTLSVSEVNFEQGSPSANHRDEWQYQWTNNKYGNISAANGGNNPTYSIANYPVNDDNSTDYTFNCEVRHVVWDDNVGGERHASAATSATTPIRVHISMENGVRTIVEKK